MIWIRSELVWRKDLKIKEDLPHLAVQMTHLIFSLVIKTKALAGPRCICSSRTFWSTGYKGAGNNLILKDYLAVVGLGETSVSFSSTTDCTWKMPVESTIRTSKA